MLAGSARLEQLLGDAPDVGAAEYLVGPGLGELEPDDAPVQAGDGYPSPRPRRTCSGTPTPRAPGERPRGAAAPEGRVPAGGALGPRRRTSRPSRWVGVRDRYAGGVLGAADGVRASPGTVPSPGTSLAGTADWSLGGAPPGPAASVYRSRCGGDAGTGTRPPPAPGHRPVRPPRGPGGAPLAPPWCPVGERRGGRRAPRCPTGPRLEELVPGAVGEPLGEETPLSPGIAKRSGYPFGCPFAGVGGRGSLRLSSRHGGRGSPCSSSNRFRDVLHQVRGRGGVPGCSPGATYRMLPREPGSEGVDDGDCSGLNSSPPPRSHGPAQLPVRVGPWDVPGGRAGTPASCRVPPRRGPGERQLLDGIDGPVAPGA